MKIDVNKLKYLKNEYKEEILHDNWYRLVWIYDDHYYIGSAAQTPKDYMIELCDSYPITEDTIISNFYFGRRYVIPYV